MTDLVERLRLGEGTSPDHLLLLEAAEAIEKMRAFPDQLLDVHAICDARDQFRNWLQNANELLRDAPIHHYGSDYERWKTRRDAHLTLAGDA